MFTTLLTSDKFYVYHNRSNEEGAKIIKEWREVHEQLKRSNWILAFDGKSLTQPDKKGWKVKRDGGEFDQFTGATITPRAVVKAVHQALLYFEHERKHLVKDKS